MANKPPGNARVAKVSVVTGGVKVGPSFILKVISGDKFNVTLNSWWSSSNTPGTPLSPLNDIVAALDSGIPRLSGG